MEPTKNEYGAIGIYIAGPMRGIPEWNFPAFHQVHQTMWRAHWETWDHESPNPFTFFCPACHDEENGFNAEGMAGTESLSEVGFSLRTALRKDLSWIARHADVVIVLPGWENSLGARAEVALAHALDIIVTAWDDQADGFGDAEVIQLPVENLRGLYDDDPGCTICGRDNRNGTHTALERTGHLSHPFTPAPTVTPEDLDRWAGDLVEPVRHEDEVPVAEGGETPRLKDGEVRVTASSGGQKGTKPARFELIPAGPLWLLAELYGKGAQKYDDRNWERGYPWSLSFGAAARHMIGFWKGEDYDAHKDNCPEDCVQHTELPHVICAVFHMFALAQFMEHNNDFDDRPIR